jgi:hypothetical protein
MLAGNRLSGDSLQDGNSGVLPIYKFWSCKSLEHVSKVCVCYRPGIQYLNNHARTGIELTWC